MVRVCVGGGASMSAQRRLTARLGGCAVNPPRTLAWQLPQPAACCSPLPPLPPAGPHLEARAEYWGRRVDKVSELLLGARRLVGVVAGGG